MLHGVGDVFVLPSIIDSGGETEGLGMVILEAMKSGLPVIASSVGGIIEIIKNEENGLLVPPKDPKSIAVAIEKLLSDSELRKKFIENSKKTLEEFLPQTIAHQHLDIYHNLVDN